MRSDTKGVHLANVAGGKLRFGRWLTRMTKMSAVALCLGCAASAATVLDFEQFNDSEIITTQIPGLTFTNTIVLAAGISLDEFEFPPHSGSNVASDNGSPITITFTSPVSLFSGYFTYADPLTLDGLGSASNLLASATSHFSSNLALSGVAGSSPNEFLQISSAIGFTQVTISGLASGGSFAIDDISFQSVVPEPSAGKLLIAVALAISALLLGRKLRV